MALRLELIDNFYRQPFNMDYCPFHFCKKILSLPPFYDFSELSTPL